MPNSMYGNNPYQAPVNNYKEVMQMHFTEWKDKDVPDIQDGKVFSYFIEVFERIDKFKGDNPVVVHCSAGVGRTGTFISMYYLYCAFDPYLLIHLLAKIYL